MSGNEDTETSRRDYRPSYTPHHQIPTIQKYREEKEQRKEDYGSPQDEAAAPSRTQQLGDAWNKYRHGEEADNTDASKQPYQSENKNKMGQEQTKAEDHADGDYTQGAGSETKTEQDSEEHAQGDYTQGASSGKTERDGEDVKDPNVAEDTSQTTYAQMNPKQKRKDMKKRSDDRIEREVTDPVTHLPVTIHDFTGKDLKQTPQNGPPAGEEPRSATGGANIGKDDGQLAKEQDEIQQSHEEMEALFPPPEFEAAREEIAYVYKTAVTIGVGLVSAALTSIILLFQLTKNSTGVSRVLLSAIEGALALASSIAVIMGMRQWTENRIKGVWETEVWNAERQQGKKQANSKTPESTQWLNSLMASIWPLVNPDLFTSVADTLEDVMQASLPRMVRMVSVDDIGQGSEALRILGVRWLPTGAAARSVTKDGKLEKGEEKGKSDRTVPGQGELQEKPDGDNPKGQNDDGDGEKEKEQGQSVAEGMEAEEGDFVNVEIAFAYRPRTGKKGMRDRANNAHLYLAFYLPGNIKLPVWVELHGIVGTLRLRLQLTPDPPFFSLCTLTFLGQPKVDLSCIPLLKKGPNIMDLPLISNFVQSSVDAAMAEYVAPKSLTLDLKDMLVGDDFKKDTTARGVIVVTIRRAFDFKEGDPGIAMIKSGSSDPYVSVGWAKFGKPVWSTRVILTEMHPHWEETAYILVSPEELNVDERLRVQLWDSDRSTADDDLGRIELDVKMLMRDPHSNGKMWDREDGFKALKAGEGMPGKLDWSVGYFSKQRITDNQLAEQDEDPDVKNIDQLKKKVYEESGRKLREASKDESAEIEQQKAQDLKARQDELIIASPPAHDYPTGILSIQIHQITGLELEAINKNKASKNESGTDEEEDGDDLPSAYCTIILNHQKIFRTRTKPKNSKPFFNAGCERVIRDVRTSEVHISVRDSRVHEDDPLLGIIYLPLAKLFAKRSQINGFFPLAGGIGYGRARVSLVFRSIQLQAPRQMLGWDYGTVEIGSEAKSIGLPKELEGLRLKARIGSAKGKMQANGGTWKTKGDKSIKLPVRKRYTACLIVEFRTASSIRDHTPAFAVLWLKDIPDDEEQTIKVPVWKGDMKRAEHNCLPESGTKVGEIELKVSFWSGLGAFHSKLASKDTNVGDVMEVLDTCQDNDDTDFTDGAHHEVDTDGASTSSSSDSSSDDEGEATPTTRSGASTDSLESNGKRGTIDQIKDYRGHRKQLHRKNRGIMQWKGPRTLQWMKHKIDHAEEKITSQFKHSERDTGIETEV
ncbi:hypothetical protein BU16DRAFT_524211 [Lophium mytilinum]|uniref:Meiotically up-regulated gene 190 protein n=1 Tax=Lophium mytilinum TaxID=390894 RepID=A0A6A6R5L5_9PEZI|nr:hypothetical protein BU16DRAFT_524211 [Lophium mytilinum]